MNFLRNNGAVRAGRGSGSAISTMDTKQLCLMCARYTVMAGTGLSRDGRELTEAERATVRAQAEKMELEIRRRKGLGKAKPDHETGPRFVS
ncbi:MAG: hypothetical protein L0229_20355 [Blastocatellia bacterium]|nr:hypothetical protein [Blastocatellia bacterium]